MGPFVVPTRMNGKITFWNHPLKSYNRNLIDVINSTGVCQVFTSPVLPPCPKHDMFIEKEETPAPPHPMKNMSYSISKPKTNYDAFPPATPVTPASPSYNYPTNHNFSFVAREPSETLPFDLSMNDITSIDNSMIGALQVTTIASPHTSPVTSPPSTPPTPPMLSNYPPPISVPSSPMHSSSVSNPAFLHNYDLDSLLNSVGLSFLSEKMKAESLTLDVLFEIPKEDLVAMLRQLPMKLGEAIKINYAINKLRGNEGQNK